MKKLLGLLAAFGLTASAGSVVVACGDTEEKTKAETVEVYLDITLTEGTTKVEGEKAIAEMTKVTATGKADEKVAKSEAAAIAAVTNLEKVDSAKKAVVETGKDDAVVLENVKILVEFTVEEEAAKLVDISDIKVADLTVGADDIDAQVKKAIDAKVEGTVKDKDYTITGNAEAEGKITVTAKAESKLITGSFEINVKAAQD